MVPSFGSPGILHGGTSPIAAAAAPDGSPVKTLVSTAAGSPVRSPLKSPRPMSPGALRETVPPPPVSAASAPASHVIPAVALDGCAA